MQVGPLKRHIKPLLLSNTPPVLSVGKRCMEEGFSFHWPANEAPYLVGPNGKRHQLEIDNLVPYLADPPVFQDHYEDAYAVVAPPTTTIDQNADTLGDEPPGEQESKSPHGGDSPWDRMVADHEQGNVVLPAPVSDEVVDEVALPLHPEAVPDEERAIPVGIEGNRDGQREGNVVQQT